MLPYSSVMQGHVLLYKGRERAREVMGLIPAWCWAFFIFFLLFQKNSFKRVILSHFTRCNLLYLWRKLKPIYIKEKPFLAQICMVQKNCHPYVLFIKVAFKMFQRPMLRPLLMAIVNSAYLSYRDVIGSIPAAASCRFQRMFVQL